MSAVDELAELDKEDESLRQWKASLGISTSAPAPREGPKGKTIEMDLTDPNAVARLKDNPVNIKEGVEYHVGIRFKVNYDVISGLRYTHVVTIDGIEVDKLEQIIGSYAPKPNSTPYVSNFPPDESPSGDSVRPGTYWVRSKLTDDDDTVHADFEWAFKLTKEW